MWLAPIDKQICKHCLSLYWSCFWDQAISLLHFKTLPGLATVMMTHHWQGGLRRRGQRRRKRGDSWRRRAGCCWWQRLVTLRPGWASAGVQLSCCHHHPPVLTNRCHCCTLLPPLPAKHKAFFCKFPQNQVVKEEKEEGTATIPPFVSSLLMLVSSPPT